MRRALLLAVVLSLGGLPGARADDARPGAIEGRLRSRGAFPIEDAVVYACPGGRREAAYTLDPARPPPGHAATRAGAGGAFRLDGLAPGPWALLAVAPGYTGRVFLTEVAAGEATAADVILPIGGHLGGRVLTRGGRVVPGTLVRLEHPRLLGLEARVDAEGRFAFEGLPPVEFDVKVDAAPYVLPSPVRSRTDGPDLELSVVWEARIFGAFSPLPGGPSVRQIGFRAIDAAGRTVAAATVVDDFRGDEFRFDGVPPTAVRLIFEAPGQETIDMRAKLVAGDYHVKLDFVNGVGCREPAPPL